MAEENEVLDHKVEDSPKVAFTVSIPQEFNEKFNEIQAHLQSKHKYGKVYKNQVLQAIIDEAHSRMKGTRHI